MTDFAEFDLEPNRYDVHGTLDDGETSLPEIVDGSDPRITVSCNADTQRRAELIARLIVPGIRIVETEVAAIGGSRSAGRE